MGRRKRLLKLFCLYWLSPGNHLYELIKLYVQTYNWFNENITEITETYHANHLQRWNE